MRYILAAFIFVGCHTTPDPECPECPECEQCEQCPEPIECEECKTFEDYLKEICKGLESDPV